MKALFALAVLSILFSLSFADFTSMTANASLGTGNLVKVDFTAISNAPPIIFCKIKNNAQISDVSYYWEKIFTQSTDSITSYAIIDKRDAGEIIVSCNDQNATASVEPIYAMPYNAIDSWLPFAILITSLICLYFAFAKNEIMLFAISGVLFYLFKTISDSMFITNVPEMIVLFSGLSICMAFVYVCVFAEFIIRQFRPIVEPEKSEQKS
jgi:hypothetical protein